jgi:hypothetical protein
VSVDVCRLASLAEAATRISTHLGYCPHSTPQDEADGLAVLALVGRQRLLEAVAEAAHRANLMNPCDCGRGDACWNVRLRAALAALDVDPPPTEETDLGGERNARPCESA